MYVIQETTATNKNMNNANTPKSFLSFPPCQLTADLLFVTFKTNEWIKVSQSKDQVKNVKPT